MRSVKGPVQALKALVSPHMKSLRMSASSSRRRLMTAGCMRLPAWPSMPALPALRSYACTIASAAPASFSGVLHNECRSKSNQSYCRVDSGYA